jgi:hypothetical protein
LAFAQASAAAILLDIGGWEWKRISTMREGLRSLKFCAVSFSMAVMNGVTLGTDFQQ